MLVTPWTNIICVKEESEKARTLKLQAVEQRKMGKVHVTCEVNCKQRQRQRGHACMKRELS